MLAVRAADSSIVMPAKLLTIFKYMYCGYLIDCTVDLKFCVWVHHQLIHKQRGQDQLLPLLVQLLNRALSNVG